MIYDCGEDKVVARGVAKEGAGVAKDDKGRSDEMGEYDSMERKRYWQHVSFHELPAWLKNNEFILGHYRPVLRSYKECFRSILGLHTETGNIWSHLLGCLAFIALTLHFYQQPASVFKGHEFGQKIVFIFFFLGAITCLGLSCTYHTLMCHSRRVNQVFHKLDYVGISLLIVGSYVPFTYYGFYCLDTARRVYLAVIALLSIATIVVTMADRFATPTYRPVRAFLFVCLGCFGIIPAYHFVQSQGWEAAVRELRPDYTLTMGGLYILGALLYGARIPERFLAPGSCNLVFQSHQIFHLLVVAAALLHLRATTQMASYRFSEEGVCRG